MACRGDWTTVSTDGVCANIKPGFDPEDECTAPYECDGEGNCGLVR
jgi:hypothetical protein